MKVDTRAGSCDYIAPLIAAGVPAEGALLPAGDFEIIGRGPGGRPLPVGVEIKQWDDVIACMRNGRFADQLRGMRAAYEVSWLLVEGRIRFDDGQLAVWKGNKWYTLPGRVTYQELASWLLTMCGAGGVLLWRTESQAESVEWLRSLYWWWVSKDFERHRAHLDFYLPPPDSTAPWEEPPLAAKMAVALPHIGSTLAMRVGEEFDSPEEMVLADESRWAKISGIGSKIAAAVVRAIRSKRQRSGS